MATQVEQRLGRPAGIAWRIRERLSLRGVVTQLAPFVLAFTAYFAAFHIMDLGTTGDEPHYLLVAESIAYDGDVDLRNDYASRERTLRMVNVYPLGYEAHAADYKGTGELRPLHGVGLSALLAPAVAIDGLTGARIVMVLVAALLADQLFRLLRDLGFRRRYRVPAWVAVVFCMPLLAFSSQIYPELPGALLVLVAIRVMVVGARSPAALALGSAAAAALFWLHVRYFLLSFGALLGLAIAACIAHQGEVAAPRGGGLIHGIRAIAITVRRWVVTALRNWRTIVLPLAVPYVLGFGLFIAAFERWYGTADPTAPYAAYSSTTIGSGGRYFLYDFALGDFLNPTQGWIPYVPVQWLGLAALGCVLFKFRWAAAGVLAVAVTYELVLASAGPAAGWGLPARYLIIVIPLISIPIALVLQEVRITRLVFVPLLVFSLLIAVDAVRRPLLLYPAGAHPRVFGIRSTAFLYPYPLPPQQPTSFVLTPGQIPPQTGKLGKRKGFVIAKPGDKPGYMLYGPYVTLKEGTYRALYPLSISGAKGNEPVGVVDAAGSPPIQMLAHKVITPGEFGPRGTRTLALRFKTSGDYAIETRVYYNGHGTLKAGPVKVVPEDVDLAGAGRFHDWRRALAWVLGTILAGWLLVRAMKRRRSAY